MSQEHESADSDQSPLTELYAWIFAWKLRYLDYVKEVDRDPTLEKVSVYSCCLILRELAGHLSAMGHSHRAKHLLDSRAGISISRMLVLLEDTLVFLRVTYPKILDGFRDALFDGTPNSDGAGLVELGKRYGGLAVMRAQLLVRTIADREGNLFLTDDDIPKLLERPPDELDRLYVVAARVNKIPVGASGASPPQGDAKPGKGPDDQETAKEAPAIAEPAEPTPSSYLSLALDKARLQVHREGFPSVSLTRPLLWNLLEMLIENGCEFTDERAIRKAWSEGEDGGPEPSTVRDAVSDLRKPLRSLGVSIENERGFGWRLVDG
jgi:hypothetical protein